MAFRRTLRSFVLSFAALLLAASPALAAIEGTITNGTTGKPSAGDEVVLLELSQGMNEAAHTKTDANGHYKFDVSSTGAGPHLVRVNHANVNYFTMVPPGRTTGDLKVYESSGKVSGLSYNVETAFQGNEGTIQVVQFYIVRNQSQPARTQTGSGNLEIALPDKAKIDSADAQAPGGQPIQTAPTPKGNGRYVFDYPLRPGETTFRIMYELPYSGQMTFKPTLLFPVEQFAVITPQPMTFQPTNASMFTNQPHQGGVNIAVANNVPPTADLSFKVGGTGQMPDTSAANDQGDSTMGGGGQVAQNGRPGGGLGNPIDTPDPLTKYRWQVLFFLAAILALGAFYLVKNRQPSPTPTTEPVQMSSQKAGVPHASRMTGVPHPSQREGAPVNNSSLLLDAMKEELFQLEVDRERGVITPEEYAKTKAALDATLRRALSRQSREAAS